MTNIFISSFIGSVIIISNAYIINFLLFKKKINEFKIYSDGLFGFICIGFFSLFINFFFPLNNLVASIFLILSIFIFIYFFLKFKKKIKLIKILLIVTFGIFSLITFANINRPDAGLYHLPFITILTENKIILGLANIHYRFGHTSIFQYISAIHINHFLKNEFLNIPLAALPIFYFLFLYENFKNQLKLKNEKNINIIFLISIFSLYSFNRFSNLGNDGPANIIFFVLIIYLINLNQFKLIKKPDFVKIFLISVFLIMLKPSMIFVLIVPIFIFLISENKKTILINKSNILIIFFLLIWFLKNILISGCVIFPIKQLCFEKIFYTNSDIIKIASIEAEAWSKGYPDTKNKIGYEKYNSEFNWLKTWSENHLNKIFEKILPLLLLILLMSFKYIFKISYYKNYDYQKIFDQKNLIYLLIFLMILNVIWFLKFPVYRFGLAFLSSFLIILYVIIFVNNNIHLQNKKILSSILIFGVIFICLKNFNRIITKFDQTYVNSPWPRIYSMNDKDNNSERKFKKIYDKSDNFLYMYSGGQECMFSKPPCSNYLHSNLKLKIVKGYLLFYFNNY